MANIAIKICGLSTPETVDAAVAAGATHIGFVHFEPSPRHLPLDRAAELSRRLPGHVRSVLLLVNMDARARAQAIAAVQPDVVQFHGSETPEYLAEVRQQAGPDSGLEIWKAVGVKDSASLEDALRYRGVADRLLYDAAAGKLPGGNGLAIDWSLVGRHRHQMPWILAGGLAADNIARAIRETGADMVDASSGVESAPGVKDVDRIRAFCQSARNC